MTETALEDLGLFWLTKFAFLASPELILMRLMNFGVFFSPHMARGVSRSLAPNPSEFHIVLYFLVVDSGTKEEFCLRVD